MSIKSSFIGELKNESVSTKKMLEKVPFDKADWKPHEKSMTIGRLATHIAETSHWIYEILEADEFNFATRPFAPNVAASTQAVLAIFDNHFTRSIAALENAGEEEFDKIWTVKAGDRVVYQLSKKIAIRGWGFSHTIHHRGQLSVYLRMLDISVPGMYGPSADEK